VRLTTVGRTLFPPAEADLIADVVARDLLRSGHIGDGDCWVQPRCTSGWAAERAGAYGDV
jgi:hypothetical protein